MAAEASAAPAEGTGITPAALDAPTVHVDSVPLVYIGVLLAALLQILDTTIANVAIPHMQSSLSATQESVLWVLTSYIVASAIALPTAGWLAGRFGARRLMLVSTILFILSSMLCGMAINLEEMVLFRVIQGFAGAFLMPLSQTVMLDVTRPSRHPQAMALWGGGIIVGPILGPIIGGWLTENMNWRWVFYVNVPVGAVALFLMATQLPRWPTRKVRFDIAGYVLVALSVASMQLLLDRGQHIDWFDATEAWVYAIIAACAGWMAVVHLATARAPLFDRALWHDANFTVTLLIMLVLGLSAYATLALLPPLLQGLLGYSVLTSGTVVAPRGIGVMACMILVGRLARMGVDLRLMVATGFGIIALSMFQMASWSLDVDMRHVVMTGVIQGVGLGFLFIPLNALAFSTLPAHLRADGSSLVNLSRSIGASVGISLSSLLLARSIQTNHAELAPHVSAEAMQVFDPAQAGRFAQFGEAALSFADAEVNRQAAMIGYVNDFWLMGWLCLASIPLVMLIRKPAKDAAPISAEAAH
ncbi:MAG: DHA2 family efflux MFS transporter permease subunit [Novosphingobium sp.]